MSTEAAPLLPSGNAFAGNHHEINQHTRIEMRSDTLEDALSPATLDSLRLLLASLTAYIDLHKPQARRGAMNSWRALNEQQNRRLDLAEQVQDLWAELLEGIRLDEELTAALWSPAMMQQGSHTQTCNSD
jgi:hypothetical protein